MNVLEVEDLSVRYDENLVLNKIRFNVEEGDLLGIVGPNGAGKTTLFRAILGLQKYEGRIRLFGYEDKQYLSLLPLVGYVPQKINLDPNFPATVSDVVSMGIVKKGYLKGIALLQNHGYSAYRSLGKDIEKVNESLRIVGLEKLKDRRVAELSGGELQRVLIAKALVKEPILLILDEPATGIDLEAERRFYDLLKRINEKKITIVWSSHDLNAISSLANKVACMNRELFFHGDKDEFFRNEDLLKTYTESAMQMHMHKHDHEAS